VHLVRTTSTAVATSYAYVNPVIALALGVGLAGETIGPASALGASVIVGAVLLLTRGKAASAAAAPPRAREPEPVLPPSSRPEPCKAAT
jgi:drug/metabolite transporter (DMT)-like permease